MNRGSHARFEPFSRATARVLWVVVAGLLAAGIQMVPGGLARASANELIAAPGSSAAAAAAPPLSCMPLNPGTTLPTYVLNAQPVYPPGGGVNVAGFSTFFDDPSAQSEIVSTISVPQLSSDGLWLFVPADTLQSVEWCTEVGIADPYVTVELTWAYPGTLTQLWQAAESTFFEWQLLDSVGELPDGSLDFCAVEPCCDTNVGLFLANPSGANFQNVLWSLPPGHPIVVDCVDTSGDGGQTTNPGYNCDYFGTYAFTTWPWEWFDDLVATYGSESPAGDGSQCSPWQLCADAPCCIYNTTGSDGIQTYPGTTLEDCTQPTGTGTLDDPWVDTYQCDPSDEECCLTEASESVNHVTLPYLDVISLELDGWWLDVCDPADWPEIDAVECSGLAAPWPSATTWTALAQRIDDYQLAYATNDQSALASTYALVEDTVDLISGYLLPIAPWPDAAVADFEADLRLVGAHNWDDPNFTIRSEPLGFWAFHSQALGDPGNASGPTSSAPLAERIEWVAQMCLVERLMATAADASSAADAIDAAALTDGAHHLQLVGCTAHYEARATDSSEVQSVGESLGSRDTSLDRPSEAGATDNQPSVTLEETHSGPVTKAATLDASLDGNTLTIIPGRDLYPATGPRSDVFDAPIDPAPVPHVCDKPVHRVDFVDSAHEHITTWVFGDAPGPFDVPFAPTEQTLIVRIDDSTWWNGSTGSIAVLDTEDPLEMSTSLEAMEVANQATILLANGKRVASAAEIQAYLFALYGQLASDPDAPLIEDVGLTLTQIQVVDRGAGVTSLGAISWGDPLLPGRWLVKEPHHAPMVFPLAEYGDGGPYDNTNFGFWNHFGIKSILVHESYHLAQLEEFHARPAINMPGSLILQVDEADSAFSGQFDLHHSFVVAWELPAYGWQLPLVTQEVGSEWASRIQTSAIDSFPTLTSLEVPPPLTHPIQLRRMDSDDYSLLGQMMLSGTDLEFLRLH